MLSGEKILDGVIQSLSGLLVVEIYLDITQSEEEYFKGNIYVNVYQLESFFKKAGISVFFIYLKQGDDCPVSLLANAKDFLMTYVCLRNAEA